MSFDSFASQALDSENGLWDLRLDLSERGQPCRFCGVGHLVLSNLECKHGHEAIVRSHVHIELRFLFKLFDLLNGSNE